jgi:hypothetical protein
MKSKKRISINRMPTEIIKLQSETIFNIDNIENEIEKITNRFVLDKNRLMLQILENKKIIKSIDKDKKKLKSIFAALAKEQRIYYLDILKKGIDVR